MRILDYLDIHYYPQANGVALSNDESASTSALRLRSLRGLYDRTYTDESWIGQPVNLIPRMKQWIAQNYPGTKLAITEYNWGNDDGPSSALAQAEALAIFGREGVDIANRWVAPAEHSRVEDAFALYLSYDGQGAKVGNESVSATSSDANVGAYALRNASSVYALLFNRDTTAKSATPRRRPSRRRIPSRDARAGTRRRCRTRARARRTRGRSRGGGRITSGARAGTIAFNANSGSSLTLSVTVKTGAGCSSTGSKTISLR